MISKCLFNDDWYILITHDGNIYGEYIKYDERAEKEYNISLIEFKKQFEKRKLNNNSKLVKRLK